MLSSNLKNFIMQKKQPLMLLVMAILLLISIFMRFKRPKD